MKRAILSASVILLCLILGTTAIAELDLGALNDELFLSAKQAVRAIDQGDWESAASLIGGLSSAELKAFVSSNFSQFDGHAQTDVAVALWNGSLWALAIPLRIPDDPGTETFVLTGDGSGFGGYLFARWSQIEQKLASCDYAVWNREYLPGGLMYLEKD